MSELYKCSYKALNEKLIHVAFRIENSIIKDISITGDFFIHPEEGIFLIENAISEKSFCKISLEKNLKLTIQNNNLELLGISVESILTTIQNAGGFNGK